MEKVYTVSLIGEDTDLYEVCIYKNGVEVDYHIVSRESRLQELISDLEAEGYERELTEDQYEEEAADLGLEDDEEDYDILELRDQWDACDDDLS